MKLVSIGAALLAVASLLSPTYPDSDLLAQLLVFGLLLTFFGAIYWLVVQRSGSPTPRHDREVVWSALGLLLCTLLPLFGGTVALIGFLLWWVALIAFVLTSISRLLAVRRVRRAAPALATDTGQADPPVDST